MSFPLPSASPSLGSAAAHADNTDGNPPPAGLRRLTEETQGLAVRALRSQELLDIATAKASLDWVDSRMNRLKLHIRTIRPKLHPYLTERLDRYEHLSMSTRGTLRDGLDPDQRNRLTRDVLHLQNSLEALSALLSQQSEEALEIPLRRMEGAAEEAKQVVHALTQGGYDASTAAQLSHIDTLIRSMDEATTLSEVQQCLGQLLQYLQSLKSPAARPLLPAGPQP